MRQKIVLLAIACLVSLPLVAATGVPASPADDSPTVEPAPGPEGAPASFCGPGSGAELVTPQSHGRCTTNKDCNLWCPSGFGFCQSTGYCICVE